jgi:hypothetical protein
MPGGRLPPRVCLSVSSASSSAMKCGVASSLACWKGRDDRNSGGEYDISCWSTMLQLFTPTDGQQRRYPLVMRVSLGVSIDCILPCCREVDTKRRGLENISALFRQQSSGQSEVAATFATFEEYKVKSQ